MNNKIFYLFIKITSFHYFESNLYCYWILLFSYFTCTHLIDISSRGCALTNTRSYVRTLVPHGWHTTNNKIHFLSTENTIFLYCRHMRKKIKMSSFRLKKSKQSNFIRICNVRFWNFWYTLNEFGRYAKHVSCYQRVIDYNK